VVPVVDEYLAVIRAMAARDVDAAVEAATNHIAGARNRALRL
jgi:DNA-binding GntR family transcriptional regulator